MSPGHVCVACGKTSPQTETDYTLISARHGWRLSRERSPDGTVAVEWRCPDCWVQHKATRSSIPAAPMKKSE